jgi:hypothetical protein
LLNGGLLVNTTIVCLPNILTLSYLTTIPSSTIAMPPFYGYKKAERTQPSDLPEVPYHLIAKDHLCDLYDEIIKYSANKPIDGGFGSFCASEIARITHGWAADGHGISSPEYRKFHPGIIICAADRRITRSRCSAVIEDLVS